MIDISFGGLLGAIAGTVVAAVAYVPLAVLAQRWLGARRSPEEPAASAGDLALLRRGVLAFDILLFGGLGYWIGYQFDL